MFPLASHPITIASDWIKLYLRNINGNILYKNGSFHLGSQPESLTLLLNVYCVYTIRKVAIKVTHDLQENLAGFNHFSKLLNRHYLHFHFPGLIDIQANRLLFSIE